MLNYCGWINSFMIMESLNTACASFVTTLVPSIYPKPRFNIQSLNISKFDIISFKTWWRKKLCSWSSSTSIIRRQTSLLNHLMVDSLNLFVRPLVSVSSLDSYPLCDLLLFIGASLLYRSHMCMFLFHVFACCFCWSYFACSVFEYVEKFKNP